MEGQERCNFYAKKFRQEAFNTCNFVNKLIVEINEDKITSKPVQNKFIDFFISTISSNCSDDFLVKLFISCAYNYISHDKIASHDEDYFLSLLSAISDVILVSVEDLKIIFSHLTETNKIKFWDYIDLLVVSSVQYSYHSKLSTTEKKVIKAWDVKFDE